MTQAKRNLWQFSTSFLLLTNPDIPLLLPLPPSSHSPSSFCFALLCTIKVIKLQRWQKCIVFFLFNYIFTAAAASVAFGYWCCCCYWCRREGEGEKKLLLKTGLHFGILWSMKILLVLSIMFPHHHHHHARESWNFNDMAAMRENFFLLWVYTQSLSGRR